VIESCLSTPSPWFKRHGVACRADDVRGQSVDCGHHIAEEAPAELARHLAGFFAGA
jgi:hypothetical protein